jgi:hypothetical protein
MLLVLGSFRQEPDFVAPVVEPLVGTWRKVLAGELRIHKQIRVPAKRDLD